MVKLVCEKATANRNLRHHCSAERVRIWNTYLSISKILIMIEYMKPFRGNFLCVMKSSLPISHWKEKRKIIKYGLDIRIPNTHAVRIRNSGERPSKTLRRLPSFPDERHFIYLLFAPFEKNALILLRNPRRHPARRSMRSRGCAARRRRSCGSFAFEHRCIRFLVESERHVARLRSYTASADRADLQEKQQDF